MRLIAAIAVITSLALPAAVNAQYYGYDPSIQQRTQDMMQHQSQMQQQERMHQDRMMQEQNRQMQIDRMYQQQRLDNMRRESNTNYGLPPLGY